MIRFVIIFALSLNCIGFAEDVFYLKNTNERTAAFSFYVQDAGWMTPPLRLIPQERGLVRLTSPKLHFLRLKMPDGVSEDLDWIDFHRLLENKQGTEIALSTVYVTETRIRTEQRMTSKTVTEERQHTKNYTIMVPVTKVREYVFVDPRTGKKEMRLQTYTEMVPETRTKVESYTVQVPVSELTTVEVPYTVNIARSRLSLVIDGKPREIETIKGKR